MLAQRRRVFRSASFALFLVLSANAFAQEKTGPYVGIALGQLDYEENLFAIAFADTALSYKVYGGYRLNDVWAVEAYYGQTDDLKWTSLGNDPIIGGYSANLVGDYDVLSVRGLAHFDWFLVGLGYWDADLSASLSVSVGAMGPSYFPASDSDSGASLIVGGEWRLDKWAIRAEFEYFDTDSAVDAHVIGLGIQRSF